MCVQVIVFFFSSRRRHTRCSRDWSSDVCSSDLTARETLFVPLDSAGFEILYQVESRSPVHIVLSFQPDLDLMWPGGIGGQSYEWNARRHAFVLLESSGKYSALVGSPQAGDHSTPDSYARPRGADRRVSLELDIPRERSEER